MRTIKGPAIFLAQFAGDAAPFDTLAGIARWAAGHGYSGVQIPSWDARLFDLALASESRTYCDEVLGTLSEAGVELTELSTHLQGQLVAVHPAYNVAFDGFAPPSTHGNAAARQQWAVDQLHLAARASRNLGLSSHATFSGALLWPFLYPWPQRPPGLVDTGFEELARRWRPILDAFDAAGVDLCYEIHPTEDLHDGITFEMFLDRVGNHPRLPRQGRRVQPERPAGRLFQLPALDRPRRPVPLARRRPDRLRRHLRQARAVRLPRLGRARMGMLPQGWRAGRGRGGAVHRLPHRAGRFPRVR